MDEIFSFSSNKRMGLGRDLALSSQCVCPSHPCNNNYGVDAVENDVGFSSDDEVEAPDFDEERYPDSPIRAVSHSLGLERDGSTFEIDEQRPSNEGSKMFVSSVLAGCTVSETLDLYAKGKQKQFNPCTLSAASEDAKRPLDNYSNMGRRPRMRAKSSSHCQGHKKRTFWSSIQKWKDRNSSSDDDMQDEPETIDYWPVDESVSEHLGCSDVKQMSESNLTSLVESDIQHDRSRHSMVELLDELQGKRRDPHFKCKMGGRRKEKMGQHTMIGGVSSSGKDIVSDEDPCEVMDSGSSTDNEDKTHNPALAVVESKRRTMAEKFQEAFGSSVDDGGYSFGVLNKSSNGVFGRLQQVLQRQKEREMEFKNLQIDIWLKGEARCLDVKILSRSYDAKLIVCQCSLLENEESSLENPQRGNFGKIWTIIFSPRVCGDVDLEVAKLVRVHLPWKEVQVLCGGEIIILATYYSQIYT